MRYYINDKLNSLSYKLKALNNNCIRFIRLRPDGRYYENGIEIQLSKLPHDITVIINDLPPYTREEGVHNE